MKIVGGLDFLTEIDGASKQRKWSDLSPSRSLKTVSYTLAPIPPQNSFDFRVLFTDQRRLAFVCKLLILVGFRFDSLPLLTEDAFRLSLSASCEQARSWLSSMSPSPAMKLPYSKAIFLSVIDVLTSIIPVPDTFLVIAETCSFVRWTIGRLCG